MELKQAIARAGIALSNYREEFSGLWAVDCSAAETLKEHAKDMHMKNVYHRALAIAYNFDDELIAAAVERAEKDMDDE